MPCKVIDPKNLPLKMPMSHILIAYLLLDNLYYRFGVQGVWFGVVLVLTIIYLTPLWLGYLIFALGEIEFVDVIKRGE